jgi:hypothetical protein
MLRIRPYSAIRADALRISEKPSPQGNGFSVQSKLTFYSYHYDSYAPTAVLFIRQQLSL